VLTVLMDLAAAFFAQAHAAAAAPLDIVAVATGDGSGNQEHQPDIRYAWRPGT